MRANIGLIEDEGYRTVVNQMELHVRAKASAFNLTILGARAINHYLEYLLAMLGISRRGETGPAPFLGIGCKRELRHQQQTTIDILERQIHLVLGVGKHAVIEQALDIMPGR